MAAETTAPGPLARRVEKMDMELKEHFSELRSFVGQSLAGLESRLTKRFDERLANVDGHLEGMDQRLEGIDKRLGVVDKRLDGMDKRLDGIDGKLDGLQVQFTDMQAKFDMLVWRAADRERLIEPVKRTKGRRRRKRR